MPNWDISGGFFYILFAGRISEAAMGGEGVRRYNMINMKIKELRTALSRIFSKIRISAGCSLYTVILISPKGTAMAGGKIIVLD